VEQRITEVQQFLAAEKLDGWLLFDFHGLNPIAGEFLQLKGMQTRRWFYWIPAQGKPHKITHAIEQGTFVDTPGVNHIYSSWQEMESHLGTILAGAKTIAMEYSPEGAIPYVSRVDGGTLEIVRKCGVTIASSADLVQYFQARWSDEQLAGHRRAAQALAEIKDLAFRKIAAYVAQGKPLSEYDIQQLILQQYADRKLLTEHVPICAVNANASNPHYEPTEAHSAPITSGDLVLIDIWARLDLPGAVFADITWMAYCGSTVPAKMAEVFAVLKNARDSAVELVNKRLIEGRPVYGYEVDDIARGIITEAGYGKYFTHRTGHSIGASCHGNGVNIDNLETRDRRRIIPGVAFSIEPGIYLPEFGVRTEIDVFAHENKAEVTTQPVQQEIVALKG
jgi:Xaa-Pro aminopeptidase